MAFEHEQFDTPRVSLKHAFGGPLRDTIPSTPDEIARRGVRRTDIPALPDNGLFDYPATVKLEN